MNARKSERIEARQKVLRMARTDAGATIEVDTTRLPRPARTMACNALDVHQRGSSVEIVFGQQAPGGIRLHAVLVVSIPAKTVPLVLNASESPNFRERVEGFILPEIEGLPEMSISPNDYPTDRFLLERASTMTMSHVDHEADVRFYRIMPTDLRRMQQDDDLTADFLQPVVDIAMSTEHLACLVAKLDDLRATLGGS